MREIIQEEMFVDVGVQRLREPSQLSCRGCMIQPRGVWYGV
jgi:hypothetical protein